MTEQSLEEVDTWFPGRVRQTFESDRADLISVVEYARRIATLLPQAFGSAGHSEVALALFAKAIFHAVTLLQVLPKEPLVTERSGPELWDVSSQFCLVRAIMECLDGFVYITHKPDPPVTTELLLNGLSLHEVDRRIQVLEKIGSVDPQVDNWRAQRTQLRAAVLGDPALKGLGPKARGDIEAGKYPDFLFDTPLRLKALGIDRDSWAAAKNLLSAYVHGHMLALNRLSQFSPGDLELLRDISIGMRYALFFVVKLVASVEPSLNVPAELQVRRPSKALAHWVLYAR